MAGLTGSGVQVDEDTRTWTNDGDHERHAHYIDRDQVMDGYVLGKPVIALCGKIWVPSRDPEKFPICPTCKEIYSEMQR